MVIGLGVCMGLLAASAAQAASPGSLQQLPGKKGCVADASSPRHDCTPVRAMAGPSPFTGSASVAVSGDGGNVYVAASKSNAITVLKRTFGTAGALTQLRGAAGCAGPSGCVRAVGLRKPTSVAVSPDGNNVYATGMGASAVAVFARKGTSGALVQKGCIAAEPLPGCTQGTALLGADVVAVSRDGQNVYVGSFLSNAIVTFARDASTGALTQTSCVAQDVAGCTPATGIAGVEGLAVAADGQSVYAGAAITGAVASFARDPSTGALTQVPATGVYKSVTGADSVAVTPNGVNVYVAAGLNDGLAAFSRDNASSAIFQLDGTSACIVAAIAEGCALGRAFTDPEGVAVSPDNRSVYVGAFTSSAVDTFDRNTSTGQIVQKTSRDGCIVAKPKATCRTGRALGAANGVAVSPDGRNVYVGAFASDAVAVFRRAR
jgi:DNA-binding beta-propeller fold protein YncE